MNTLPNFAANIMKPINKAIEDDRSIEDIAGIIEEIRMFACLICGHITPDHRWTPPHTCLKADCECTGVIPEWDEQPDLINEVLTGIDAIIRGKAA